MPTAAHLQLILGVLDLLDESAQNIGLGSELIKLRRGETALLQDTIQTRQLLARIIVVLAQLVEYLDIVLGILGLGALLDGGGLLCHLSSSISQDSLAASELVNDNVECVYQTRGSAETTTLCAVGTSLLVQEGHQVFLGAAAVVGLALLAAGGEELNGRIGAHALLLGGGLAVLGISINLGDDDVDLVLEIVGELLPGGCEVLAVCRRRNRVSEQKNEASIGGWKTTTYVRTMAQ